MKFLKKIFSNTTSSGILLIVATAIAVLLANVKTTSNLYYAFLEIPIELKIGKLEINENVLLLINDALMTVFFLLIGLEVKRELIIGSMASFQKATLPIFTAVGGMIVPSLIYLIFNFQDSTIKNGWAIPAATDIAFALGILSLLGSRIPIALKTFLMSLAIIDDLGSIVIIAIFYANKLSIIFLKIAAVTIIILWILNLYNIKYITIYIIFGIILWIAILKSGIHAPIAGIIISFFIPLNEKEEKSPLKILEKILHPWVTFLILPLFAFANAGISFQEITINKSTLNLLSGIIVGLFIGKPLGISFFCWIALKLKLVTLPKGTTFKQIIAAGVLCGIGFTMSILISTLAFDEIAPELIILAKLGILVGSLLAATFGYFLLRKKIKLPA